MESFTAVVARSDCRERVLWEKQKNGSALSLKELSSYLMNWVCAYSGWRARGASFTIT